MPITRNIAYKVWVSDLINNNYVQTSGEFESNYVELTDKKLSRINIIANVIDKFESEDKNYMTLILDDGSEQIRIKTWREDTRLLNNINISDTVLVIGKVKKYNDEIYILPEIVKTININWELSRKLELLNLYGKPKETKIIKNVNENNQEKIVVEEISFGSSNLRNEILNLIEKNENKNGVSLDDIKLELHSSLEEINKVLDELIKEGQIYLVSDKFRLLL